MTETAPIWPGPIGLTGNGRGFPEPCVHGPCSETFLLGEWRSGRSNANSSPPRALEVAHGSCMRLGISRTLLAFVSALSATIVRSRQSPQGLLGQKLDLHGGIAHVEDTELSVCDQTGG